MKIITKCRVCHNNNLKKVISLGSQPLANNLLKYKNERYKKYPLTIMFCSSCANCQLSVSVSSKSIFDNYLYKSSVSKDLVMHFERAARKICKKYNIDKKKHKIVDVGSNDGIFLKAFKKCKIQNLIGIEPAKNLANLASNNNFKIYNNYLDTALAKKLKFKAKIITATNVFAHVDNIQELIKAMILLLEKNGVIIIEIQYLPKMVSNLIYDNIYHEHVNYWSLTSLQYFFDLYSFVIHDCDEINTHGGSLRIYASHKSNNIKISKKINILEKIEKLQKVNKSNYYKTFNEKIYRQKKLILEYFQKRSDKEIIGYGAPAKATVTLNYLKISKYIKYIIDDNELKVGKFIPGSELKIEKKFKNKADIVIIFAWNYFKSIKKKINNYSKKIIHLQNFNRY
jgi:hypothetical protein